MDEATPPFPSLFGLQTRVYVDEAVIPFRGWLMAHMFSPSLPALHDMASVLGVRKWFQDPGTMNVSWPHYDISAELRMEAIDRGAVALDRYQALVMANFIAGRPQQQLDYAPVAKAMEWLADEIARFSSYQRAL